jgi:predicted N-formylglutamate amidohydrolase
MSPTAAALRLEIAAALETHPVEAIEGSPTAGLILLCDHASNAVPPDLAHLGLARAQFERHIGYDIGAADLTRALARLLGAPAVLTTFSRLVIDPNRGRDDPTLVMRLSDGAVVPGNARMGPDEVERRLRRFYDPYDDAIQRRSSAPCAPASRPRSCRCIPSRPSGAARLGPGMSGCFMTETCGSPVP